MSRKSNERNSDNGRKNKSYRFFIIAAVFVLLCITFLVTLAIIQKNGPSVSDDDRGLDVRTETVRGQRGKIYDRNGVLLVEDSQKYDLIFEYGSMAYDVHGVNSALLRCISVLNGSSCSDKRVEDYFPFDGNYPNFTLSADATDPNTTIGLYYNKFLVKNSLPADASVEQVMEYFAEKYKFEQKKYLDEQINELIRIRYDMERVGFGAYQEYVIAEGFDPNVKDEKSFITHIESLNIEGITVLRQRGRVYHNDGYAAHILGTVGKIEADHIDDYEGYPLDALVGKSGCELAFEEYLRGSDGTLVKKYNENGELVEQYYDPEPVIGNNIYLTIDINLQKSAEDALAEEIERLEHSEKGAATAMDPQTGEVLVVASYPPYEISQLNRALNEAYAPGSTYKIGSALAALEQNAIDTSSTRNCEHTFPNNAGPACMGTHGSIPVSEAIRVSCNVFFDYLGHEMGLDKITQYTKKLGLGAKTGIELSESVGTIASKGYCEKAEIEWRDFDNASGAIGQSYHTYTPLQLSVYTSSIVNHGTRYEAHLLKKIEKHTQEVIFEKAPTVAEKIEFSQHTYDTLMSAMESVVSSHDEMTSYFSGVGQTVGGKTGTAQTGTYDNALFIGFAPVSSPQIVASCVLEAGEAGTNASKIVADIFEKYFNPTPEEAEVETEKGT